jgi:hypothetical protein
VADLKYRVTSTGEYKHSQIPDDVSMSRNILEGTTNACYVDATNCGYETKQRNNMKKIISHLTVSAIYDAHPEVKHSDCVHGPGAWLR